MKVIYLALIGIIILSVTSHANATKLRVVTEDLAPNNYVYKNEIVGHNTKLIKYLLDSQNIDYTLEAYPWARSYHIAMNQPNVLIYTINRIPQRESMFHWIGEFPLSSQVSFYRLNNSLLVTTNYNDIDKLRIGTQINTANEQFLRQHSFKNISSVSHLKQSIGMLLLGRIDLIIGSKHQIEQALHEQGLPLDTVEFVTTAYKSQPSFALSRETAQPLVKQLQDAYQQLSINEVCRIMDTPQCIKPHSNTMP